MKNLPKNFELAYSREEILEQITQMGKSISQWAEVAQKNTNKPVLAVCILKGSVFFFSDLLLNISSQIEPSFCRTWGYSTTTNTREKGVRVSIDDIYAAGRAVLIIDDICDSGSTLLTLHNMFSELGATEVKSAVTILREVDSVIYNPTWVGFVYPGKEWFVGYGMDYNDQYRNLPNIYKIKP